MTEMTGEKLASYIDHTLLAATATSGDIKQHCKEAVEYGFCTVLTNPRWIPLVSELLIDSKVKVGSVISFPFGTELPKTKTTQAKEAIFAGADEIDMVADLASVIEGNRDYLLKDIKKIAKICHSMRPKVTLKIIIETAALTCEQKIFACQIAAEAGADFLKTSTGLHKAGGATTEDVYLLKANAAGCKVKAAGGIKTLQQTLDMIVAGADRIGTSSGVAIITEMIREKNQ